jgi:hypothetical protein
MRSRIVSLAILSVLLLFATCTLVFVPVTGCSTSQQRTVVNTLASTGQATDAAIKTYLDQVLAGKVKTNDVPTVMARYNEFQTAWNIALVAATLNTNAPPDVATANAASQVQLAIKAAKGK